MSFYLKPPRGTIQLHDLEDCIQQRINYFQHIRNNTKKYVRNFNYLVDETAYDRVGHFILRLLCAKLNLYDYFIENERRLFTLRLQSYNAQLLKRAFKIWKQHVCDIFQATSSLTNTSTFDQEKNGLLEVLQLLCDEFLKNDNFVHIFSSTHDNKCDTMYFKLPFIFCLKNISTYEFELRDGFGYVPCGKWQLLLEELFEFNLECEHNLLINSTRSLDPLDDSRLEYLLERVNSVQLTPQHEKGTIRLENLDVELENFPLCMQILHRTLEKEHRLHHDDRINLTLFFKSIGLPLSQAILYWKAEYTKPSSHCAACSHEWSASERRYTYSLRHMYGLEGSRRDYQCRSCKQLQNDCVSTRSVGGCPFHLLSDNELKTVLEQRHLTENVINTIVNIRRKQPNEACLVFFKSGRGGNMNDVDNVSILNPVQYYFLYKR